MSNPTLSSPPTPLHVRVYLLFNSITFYSLGAFWKEDEEDEEDEEEEFLAKKKEKGPSKKKTKQCHEKYIGIQACIDSTAARNTNATRKWERNVFRDNRRARQCAQDAFYDEDVLDCYSGVLERIARRCPVPVDEFKEACKIPFEDEDEELESTYATYLRA